MVFQALLKRGVTFNSIIRRLVSTKLDSPKTLYVECLENRTLIKVIGNGVDDYLQGLITNDVKHLTDSSPALYAMFLNSKGRVLCDSIIYNTNEPATLLIECDKSACNNLQKHLMMYRVRRKIEVHLMEENLRLWVVNNNQASLISPNKKNDIKPLKDLLDSQLNNCLVCCDPRISFLGVRIIAPKSLNVTDALKNNGDLDIINEKFYKLLRYKLGVGEGTNELPPEKCFPLESNCDYLNGVSFHKGCYLGQELTARTYHTGVTRKRLMPVILDEKIDCSDPEIPILTTATKEKPIGKLRGIEGNLGIGLLRIEEALEASNLTISGKVSRTHKPFWWPTGAKLNKMDQKEEIETEGTEETDEIEVKWFRCYNCNLKQQYDVKGRTVEFAKHIKLKEESYLLKDPFSPNNTKNILIIGSDCIICKNQVCQSQDCSIYFKNRYCQRCASENKSIFPQQLSQKIKIV